MKAISRFRFFVGLIASVHSVIGQSIQAEQQETVWVPGGKAERNPMYLTRAENGTLSVHRFQIFAVRPKDARDLGSYFHFVDYENGLYYTGITKLAASFPFPVEPTALRRSNQEQFGSCDILTRPDLKSEPGGRILGYDVVRVEVPEDKERSIYWIARDLGCFPLKREIREGEDRRLLIETKSVKALPAKAKVTIPTGMRVVSPKEFCTLYKAFYGVEYAPATSCDLWEGRYQGIAEEVRRRIERK